MTFGLAEQILRWLLDVLPAGARTLACASFLVALGAVRAEAFLALARVL